MAYTTINKSSNFFTTATWSGTSSQQTISLPFQADWIWVKRRNSTVNHASQDIVNAFGNRLSPNRNVVLGSEPHGIGTVDANGFNFKGSYNGSGYNESGGTYVSWNWKANGAGSANTDGSINTTATSVNTTAGFSISKYTGTGSNATIGHGLGAVPQVVLIKELNGTNNWLMSHQPLSASLGDYSRFITLNSTGAVSGAGNVVFQNSAFTSSVFNVGTSAGSNGSGQNFIAYCFAEKTGYSKFGIYTGNGNANGTFVYTGFKPALVMIKSTGNAENWFIFDNKRPGYNLNANHLNPNSSAIETNSSANTMDILSNGFKMRATNNGINRSGDNFIYMAFGQSLVGDNNVPCTAR
jgi:hypothetical protein